MIEHIDNIALSYRDMAHAYHHRDRVQQNLTDTKKSARNHAVAQGILAIGCAMLGHYALDKNNPFAFLICLAAAKGAVEQHTKALSKYLTARRKLRTLNSI